MFLDKNPFNKCYEILLLMKYKYAPIKYEKWWLKNKGYSASDKEKISFSYDILTDVSRSFSHVTRLLPEQLSLAVTNFYLRCRALDTIEDDPTAFSGNIKEKRKYLKNFYKSYTNLQNVGEEKYRPLLYNYDKIGEINKLLTKGSQTIIDKVLKDMGRGMGKYLNYRIKDMNQYNKYCYYVAGLVGTGLGRLFTLYQYVSPDFISIVTDPGNVSANHRLGGIEISMGLFLQKTNITRDYKEDFDEGIQWYPEDIWKKYKPAFSDFNGDIESRNCVNELVTDALDCVQDVFKYHKLIRHPGVFNFCVIPQIMAIATLHDIYDNPEVFKKTIKIDKGAALNIMYHSNNMDDMYYWFKKYVLSIKAKIRSDDPNSHNTHRVCNEILSTIQQDYRPAFLTAREKTVIISLLVIIYTYINYKYRD